MSPSANSFSNYSCHELGKSMLHHIEVTAVQLHIGQGGNWKQAVASIALLKVKCQDGRGFTNINI